MEKSETASRGKVILATVKGDVHDIGKNLVDIILSNNGFEVINLGIKIPSEKLIEEIEKNRPDIVGLSGLLVKSAQQMALTADDLCRAGIDVPIMVGGAALSLNFTAKKIAPAYQKGSVFYAKDAMEGLDLAKKIRSPKEFEKLKVEWEKKKTEVPGTQSSVPSAKSERTERSETLSLLNQFPKAPDWEPHKIVHTPIDEIWSYINLRMLLGRHLGVKGSQIKWIEQKKWGELKKSEDGKKSLEIWETLEQLKKDCKQGLIPTAAVYQFFRASSQGNTILIWDPSGKKKLAEVPLPRQSNSPFLCIADYLSPDVTAGDNLAFFVTTAGHEISKISNDWKQKGDYLKSHMLQALVLETAEGYAEWLHAKLRGLWGFPDSPQMTMMQRFQAKYQGKRYSFGYPACPDLELQKILFDLLKPQSVGVTLTEGYMMEPEASVSALTFHHPDATYFAV